MKRAIIYHSNEKFAMNSTAHAPVPENINFVAAVSTLLASVYFVAVNFLF